MKGTKHSSGRWAPRDGSSFPSSLDPRGQESCCASLCPPSLCPQRACSEGCRAGCRVRGCRAALCGSRRRVSTAHLRVPEGLKRHPTQMTKGAGEKGCWTNNNPALSGEGKVEFGGNFWEGQAFTYVRRWNSEPCPGRPCKCWWGWSDLLQDVRTSSNKTRRPPRLPGADAKSS